MNSKELKALEPGDKVKARGSRAIRTVQGVEGQIVTVRRDDNGRIHRFAAFDLEIHAKKNSD